MNETVREGGGQKISQEALNAEIEKLTAEGWRCRWATDEED